jgi:hypothetical protein
VRKRARLVEDVVGRELFFRNEPEDAAAMHDSSGVEQLATDCNREAKDVDGRGIGGLERKAIELAALPIQKAAPLHEVFRGIATDHLFGETGNSDVRRGHLAGERDEPRHVRRHGPDRRADARHRDFSQAHLRSLAGETCQRRLKAPKALGDYARVSGRWR